MDDPWASSSWSDDPASGVPTSSSSSFSPVPIASTSSTTPTTPSWTVPSSSIDASWGSETNVSDANDAGDGDEEVVVEDWNAGSTKVSSPISSAPDWGGFGSHEVATFDAASSPVLTIDTGRRNEDGFESLGFAAPEVSLPVPSRDDPTPRPPSPSFDTLPTLGASEDAGVPEPSSPSSSGGWNPEAEILPNPLPNLSSLGLSSPPTDDALAAAVLKPTTDAEDDDWGDFGSSTLPSFDPEPAVPLDNALPKWSPAGSAPVAPWTPDPSASSPSKFGGEEGWGGAAPSAVVVAKESGEEKAGDAWAEAAKEGSARRAALRQMEPERLADLQRLAQGWAETAFPTPKGASNEDGSVFLPPGKAAMNMDVAGAMNGDGELAPSWSLLTAPPIVENSDGRGDGVLPSTPVRISLLYQNSNVQALLRKGLDATRLHAAEVEARLRAAAPVDPRRAGGAGRGRGHKGQTPSGEMWSSPSMLGTPHPPSSVFSTSEFPPGGPAYKDTPDGSPEPEPAPTGRFAGLFGWGGGGNPAPRERERTNTPAGMLTRKPVDAPEKVSSSSEGRRTTSETISRPSSSSAKHSVDLPPGGTSSPPPQPSTDSAPDGGQTSRLGRFFNRFSRSVGPGDEAPPQGAPSGRQPNGRGSDQDNAFFDSFGAEGEPSARRRDRTSSQRPYEDGERPRDRNGPSDDGDRRRRSERPPAPRTNSGRASQRDIYDDPFFRFGDDTPPMQSSKSMDPSARRSRKPSDPVSRRAKPPPVKQAADEDPFGLFSAPAPAPAVSVPKASRDPFDAFGDFDSFAAPSPATQSPPQPIQSKNASPSMDQSLFGPNEMKRTGSNTSPNAGFLRSSAGTSSLKASPLGSPHAGSSVPLPRMVASTGVGAKCLLPTLAPPSSANGTSRTSSPASTLQSSPAFPSSFSIPPPQSTGKPSAASAAVSPNFFADFGAVTTQAPAVASRPSAPAPPDGKGPLSQADLSFFDSLM